MPKATLVLQDGTRWEGEAKGAPGVAVGQLTVHAAHGGTMRLLTDPASAGQLVTLTFPIAGSYGVNTEHCETGKPWVRGVIVRAMDDQPSNWRSAETLDFFLKRHLVTAIAGIDTRAVARHLRDHGPQNAAIVATQFTGWDALSRTIASYVPEAVYPAAVTAPERVAAEVPPSFRVAVCDFGSSRGLSRLLAAMGAEAVLLPPGDVFSFLRNERYDGLILPDGPGQAERLPMEPLRALVDSGFPILGIGLGFQWLALALGARLAPLNLGHRGLSCPVRDLLTGRCAITRQNHGAAVAAQGLDPARVQITHVNVDDNTVEGLRANGKPAFGIQYLPNFTRDADGGALAAEFLDCIAEVKSHAAP